MIPEVSINNQSFPIFSNLNSNLDFTKVKTAALVASSGTLLDNNFGDEIDKHDLIIRFNAARVKGYEKYVGSRTDIRILNGHAFNGSTKKDICLGHDPNFLTTLENETFLVKSYNVQEFIEGVMKYINKNPINFLHPNFLIYCNNLVSKPEASAGLIGVLLLVTLGIKPNLYGYGFYSESNDKVHYWEEVNSNWSTGHGFDEEKNIIDDLYKNNLLNIIK